MKKLLSIILCIVILLCLFSCNQAPVDTSTPPPEESVFTEGHYAETREPTEKPPEEYADRYYEIYGRISVGDTYADVVSVIGKDGQRLSCTDIRVEWELGDGKFLHVIFDKENLKTAKITERMIVFAEEKEEESEEETSQAETEKAFTKEELSAIRKVADDAMELEYPDLDREKCNVSIRRSSDGDISVTYTVTLEGISSSEDYRIYMSSDLSVQNIYAYDSGKFSSIKDIPEGAIRQANEKLLSNTEKYNNTSGRLYIYGGRLYVRSEVILYVLYPSEANISPSDHIHVFFLIPVSE